jgi:hypothetical protein
MKIANTERVLVLAVKEIAKELGIKFKAFSQNWIIRLEKNNNVKYIFGYNFDINGASGQLIANDKCATAELLTYNKVPAVEHRLFLRPDLSAYVASEGNWQEITQYFLKSGSDLVCKSNVGTGGNHVYRAQTLLELERSVHDLFRSKRAIALSPFIDIEAEYRLIMLDKTCELAYEKIRPEVTGDGRSTLLELILKHAAWRMICWPVFPHQVRICCPVSRKKANA